MLDDIVFADLSKFKKKREIPPYPFTGIVGQQAMKRCLLLLAANPDIGSLLIMGENGTGKVTAASAIKQLLPPIETVMDCISNCDPRNHKQLCIECSKAAEKGELEQTSIPTPFIRLPIGTSRQRIFGGFEKSGAFIPGLVAIANRGYLLMERANLQDPDYLRNILDTVERGEYKCKEGDHEYIHPASFALIATANPGDGEIDPEIMSRFNMLVTVHSIRDVEERIEIVRRVESYKDDQIAFIERSQREEEKLRKKIHKARRLLRRADIPKKTMTVIETVIKKVGSDAARDALIEVTKANAAIDDRQWATVEDIADVVDIVLGHRNE